MKMIVALSLPTPVAESVNTVGTSIIITMNVSTRSVIYLLIIDPKTMMFITNVWHTMHPYKTNLIVMVAIFNAMIVESYKVNIIFAMLINIGLAQHQDPLLQPDLEVIPGLIHDQDLPHIDTSLHHLHNQKQNIIITPTIPKYHLNTYMKLISMMIVTIPLQMKTMKILHHTSVTFMMTFMTTTNHTYRKTHSL